MTKREREMNFYKEFRQLLFIEPTTYKEKTEIINKIIKLCFRNYTLISLDIYKVISNILINNQNNYIITNREILKIRLQEIKPYINYDSNIPIIYEESE